MVRLTVGMMSKLTVGLFILIGLSLGLVESVRAAEIEQVVVVSMDALRADVVEILGEERLPNYYRLREEGWWTDNARTDDDFTVTLPGHTGMITGRQARGEVGHGWTSNAEITEADTIHLNKGEYVPSVFDVVHDSGWRTGLYVSKPKMQLLQQSYADKIDEFVYEFDTVKLVDRFVADMTRESFNYVLVHIRDLDSAGHEFGFDPQPGSRYAETVAYTDELLGRIVNMVMESESLRETTLLIVTSDHGGVGQAHGNQARIENYRIPFYVWHDGMHGGGDLYALNRGIRWDPGTGRVGWSDARQPIRNSDSANLAMEALGLPMVPGSTVNAQGDLVSGVVAGEENSGVFREAAEVAELDLVSTNSSGEMIKIMWWLAGGLVVGLGVGGWWLKGKGRVSN